MAVKLGVFRPVTVYPFYEAATVGALGPDPARGDGGIRPVCGRPIPASPRKIPNAWLKRRFTPDEITTPTPDNRLIAWPYTKLMVANPTVNMGGAVLMTSLAKARAAGIAEDRLIHVWGGASAEEPRDYLIRDQFFESHAAERRAQGGDGTRRRRRQARSTRSSSIAAFPACRKWRGERSASAPTCSRR